MRRPVGILVVVPLGLGVAACAGSGRHVGPHGPAVATRFGSDQAIAPSNFSTRKNDRDNDGDHNNDDGKVLRFGHTADAADRRISVELLKRYYAAAAAANGARACSMLAPFIAESAAEDIGHSRALRGKSCTTVMTKLFKLRHRLLAVKSATIEVIDVRVQGSRALAVLEFPTIPEARQIIERRVGSTWKLISMLDSILE